MNCRHLYSNRVRTFDRDIDVKLALPPICPEAAYAQKLPSKSQKPHLLKLAHIRRDKKSFQLTRKFVLI